jgi:hypothetical protein
LYPQKHELADMVRQLDEQARVKQDGIKREAEETRQRAAWLRADARSMEREASDKAAAAARNVIDYRTALEGQIGDAFVRSGEHDETPFERARNSKLVAELRDKGGLGGCLP